MKPQDFYFTFAVPEKGPEYMSESTPTYLLNVSNWKEHRETMLLTVKSHHYEEYIT